VSPFGYDVWRHRRAFATEANAGAPPDSFFPRGQDWGFPPLHPERLREDGYRHLIDCVRTQLEHATVLRIDHVMALHRLFWVPRELGPDHGVYVRYRQQELYAIVALEAHRHGAVVVGEDLGTVPPVVRAVMSRHRIHRSYVLQEELEPDPEAAVRTPPVAAVASLNTHDLPTFAAFRRGLDVAERLRRGWLEPAEAEAERRRRDWLVRALGDFLGRASLLRDPGRAEDDEMLRACLAYLARSESAIVMVNLEDLWLESRPQNVPGTTEEPNWRRKMARPLEAFRRDPDVVGTLGMIDRMRKEAEP
jgi:4-alpha-glucanotransferase